MAIVNSYVSLPEGSCVCSSLVTNVALPGFAKTHGMPKDLANALANGLFCSPALLKKSNRQPGICVKGGKEQPILLHLL